MNGGRAESASPVPTDYVRESITVPSAGVRPGSVGPLLAANLTDSEVAILVDYLIETGS